jgi:hypothetical protein
MANVPGRPISTEKWRIVQDNRLMSANKRGSFRDMTSGLAHQDPNLGCLYNQLKKKPKNQKTKSFCENPPQGPINQLTALLIEKSAMIFSHEPQKEMQLSAKMLFLQDWIFKHNYSNHLLVTPTKNTHSTYKFHIALGNNGIMIRNALRYRWWWIASDKIDSADNNLVWTQLKCQPWLDEIPELGRMAPDLALIPTTKSQSDALAAKKLGPTEKSSNHKTHLTSMSSCPDSDNKSSENYTPGISDTTTAKILKGGQQHSTKTISKTSLPVNIQRPATHKQLLGDASKTLTKQNLATEESNKVYQKFHSKLFSKTETDQLQRYQMFKFKPTIDVFLEDVKSDPNDLPNTKKNFKLIEDPMNKVIHNHLEFNWHLGHKRALFFNLKNYYESLNLNVFDYCPITYTIKDLDDIEWQRFIDRYYKLESAIEEADKCPELKAKNPYPQNIWILKPGENTNKGNGISVCENIYQIKETITEEK